LTAKVTLLMLLFMEVVSNTSNGTIIPDNRRATKSRGGRILRQLEREALCKTSIISGRFALESETNSILACLTDHARAIRV